MAAIPAESTTLIKMIYTIFNNNGTYFTSTIRMIHQKLVS